ncbi:hypothetical protein OAK19_06480 [Aureispira]|nr:hypothetical protein [Aureispira sp.]
MPDRGFAAWNVERMPYNATNMGVYAVGSGTAPLPYRDILLQASSSGHPPIDDKIPTEGVYPFGIAQELGLGTSNAQFVQEIEDVGEGVSEGDGGRYMVALDWDLPQSTMTYTLPDPDIFPSDYDDLTFDSIYQGWSTNEKASVTNALRQSCWCVASPTRYLPQINPLVAPTASSSTRILPQLLGGESILRYEGGPETWGIQVDSNIAPRLDADVDPDIIGQEPVFQEVFNCFTRATVRANLRSLTYQYINKNGERAPGVQPWEDPLPGDQLKWTQQYQAVVDIEVLVPDPEDARISVPRPLPWLIGEVATGVNVMVMQKNTSAPDGTDGGMYMDVPPLLLGAKSSVKSLLSARREPVNKTTTEKA